MKMKNKNYEEFIKTKTKRIIESGFDCEELNPMLFNWQKIAVKIALKKGRFALFMDCGLGKTFMQLEWAYRVSEYTNKKVLILAPLAVVEQTKRESKKFNVDISNIDINNYEQLKNINTSIYSGVVLDESSILKGKDGKTSRLLIDTFNGLDYKLCCTATPGPNDHLELGQHAEFLGATTYENMKSMFFIQDQKIKSSDKWRLKKHAKDDFWKFVCQWSMSLDDPCRIDPNQKGYNLPEIEYIEHIIPVENNTNNLFGDNTVSATDLHKDLKRTFTQRINKAAELVNGSDESWIIWTLRNQEANELNKVINDSINVQGSDKAKVKANNLNLFGLGEYKVLITKTLIASFGMNYQNCSNMLFSSYDFKFEAFYQAVRRCYRYGQPNKVKVHILIPESQKNVRASILKKQKKHREMITEMSKYSSETNYTEPEIIIMEDKEQVRTDKFWIMKGDCITRIKELKTESIDYSFFSPPFKDLYTYSDDPRDLSNVKNDSEFYDHFKYLVPEMFRVLKSGRLLSMHIMQGTTSIGKDGYLSIIDFRGELIRLFQEFGFIFHAEKMIRKNPQLAAVRTKNIQLMHGQTKRDSSINRPGLADYVITFRKPGVNEHKIQNDIPFDLWCKLAEPVWMDIQEGDVIPNFRKAKGQNDEKHMTPTQLTVIRYCYLLWSNIGDTCFSPFGGVGSEGVEAINMGRKSINIELKDEYYNDNVKNHKNAVLKLNQKTLF